RLSGYPRRVARRLLLVGAIAVLLPAPALAAGPAYAFGREGGNIRPFTATIARDGQVRVSGPVKVGRTRITAAALTNLAATTARANFATFPSNTDCPGTLPDIAAAWIKVGSHTVLVHGSCSAGFTRVWNALTAAVRLSYG